MSATVLTGGIDTLYWSTACGIAEERFAGLRLARERAENGSSEVIELGGHTLTVEPRGTGRYSVLLRCAEFSVQLTDSAHLPTALVQLRSAFLHEEGPRLAYAGSADVVQSLCDRPVALPKTSRLDVYADVGGWVLSDSDRRGLVTHAKLHPVLRAGTDEYETIQVGKQPGLLVRLYRKDIEVRAKGGFAPLLWGGYGGPVVRAEAQAGTEKLRDVGIVSVDDAVACYGELWRYALTEHTRLHIPGPGDRESWPLDERWRMLQQYGFDHFPICEMASVVKAARDQDRVAQVLLGALASWAGGLGIVDPEEALALLRRRYPGWVADEKRDFMREALRHYARVPRSVRRRLIA